MNAWAELHSREILELARKHGMTNIRVFGSMARRNTHEASDLDLLVDYAEGSNLFDQIGFKQELEERLHRSVDVVTPQSLHWFIRDKVIADAEPLSPTDNDCISTRDEAQKLAQVSNESQ
jgi:uncharacterized protein